MEHINERWGEMSEPQGVSSDFISSDLMNLLILKGMKIDPLKVHQPCENEDLGVYEVPAECSKMDSIVLHTIQLIQHHKTLQGLIKMAQEQIEKGNEVDFDGPKSLPSAPQIPELPEITQKHGFSYPFRYMEKTFSSFSQGERPPPFILNANIAKCILRKSVATLLAHTGYDKTSHSTLDTLTDVAEEYLQKFTHLLRVTVDQEVMCKSDSFPDAMERVFYDMGIGSMTVLHEFYQRRVLRYHKRMLEICNVLQEEYAGLSLPVLRPATEEIIRCGPSEVENEEDIPEIHFPALGEGYSADELQPSLEPGFQMLHSLEQEEQLQNLETEEEINVSDSPSHELNIHGTSIEQIHGSKNRKKKKKGNEIINVSI
ncbi:hypothetical protein L9F63_024171 [Diploptera punctata]|uniref:Bromodomain associated domain-containing protein n=1 Tax=Diploptera punctata TaxID=6984 RepID=A0AAD8E835_DIPPU|nr:hypothetical protein L9F63_024171 [Diploptera punctata]